MFESRVVPCQPSVLALTTGAAKVVAEVELINRSHGGLPAMQVTCIHWPSVRFHIKPYPFQAVDKTSGC